ncbi:2-oxoglutarate ferredoxin oxidoreductase subunit delta [Desulfotomaculum arcticum]|uniref:2-oxoglutarate ferredoxin oxidoreductase subunit delta n=1 Tax=Desulfotruncus arcticus DSM 17038 TaxID=1121424 RepID=A0A1I2RH54_9FIRM|nr:4Fe-4S binding protein [Desulfotruncus arcticus]SFG38829.1 2-oxoglutarate ferredoxin oxidoreductase subunit delta [Desulfotomaculum arcticum] [Desulfotruncus arcticus DSM 17038]
MVKTASLSLDRGRCKGCGLCMAFCPGEVLGIEKDLNDLGYYPIQLTSPDRCTGCGRCAAMCPDLVITVTREESA